MTAMEEMVKELHFQQLAERGYAHVPQFASVEQCMSLRGLWDGLGFRKEIVMEQFGYGKGCYKYLSYPLPDLIALWRAQLYESLVGVANEWQERLGSELRFPLTHEQFLARCHADAQVRPTPLLLRYQSGDYNRLHQDLYGAHVFPLQVAILLSQPEQEFSGGDFVLAEQQARQQAKVSVVPLRQGDAVIFAVRERPVFGKRGYVRSMMRHGVSELRGGERFSFGLIFHDAA